MRIVWIGCLVLAMSGAVRAEVKKPGKDFWKILVAPKAKWVLHDPNAGNDPARKAATVTVETYDVRTIGKAQVARLRWTHNDGAGETTFGGGLAAYAGRSDTCRPVPARRGDGRHSCGEGAQKKASALLAA